MGFSYNELYVTAIKSNGDKNLARRIVIDDIAQSRPEIAARQSFTFSALKQHFRHKIAVFSSSRCHDVCVFSY
jgi:hypothetical protein